MHVPLEWDQTPVEETSQPRLIGPGQRISRWLQHHAAQKTYLRLPLIAVDIPHATPAGFNDSKPRRAL